MVGSGGGVVISVGAVRRVDLRTGTISSLELHGLPFTPRGVWAVALDTLGRLYIATEEDSFNDRIRRVDPATGNVTAVAGGGETLGDGGPATAASLARPRGVVVDAMGNVFIADTGHHSIRRVDASTGVITTVAGTGTSGFSGDGGPATNARLADPSGVAVDASGNIFVSDTGNGRVRRVDGRSGAITTVAGGGTGGLGDGGPADQATLAGPGGLSLDAASNLFVADAGNSRVRRVDGASDRRSRPSRATAPAASPATAGRPRARPGRPHGRRGRRGGSGSSSRTR